MSNQSNFSHDNAGHYTDARSSRFNSKYHQRRGQKHYRPEYNRQAATGGDVDALTKSIDLCLTTNGNSSKQSVSRGHMSNFNGGRRPVRTNDCSKSYQNGWWSITIEQAGIIGKQRVMSTLKAHCTRPFQPYHYFIDSNTKAGVFFVNSQHDADMLKRANGKVEVQNLDTLRIKVGRVATPKPLLDEDIQPHFKDYLINHRFDQQTGKLDLSNLADDEGLSSLGIFPQFTKHEFIRCIVTIINKDLHTIRQLDLGSNNIINLYEFRNLHLDNLVLLSIASNQLKNVEDFGYLKQLPNLSHLFIKNNPLTLSNHKRNTSIDDIISIVRQKLPQLKWIDNVELPVTIRFATDFETAILPKSIPHFVPNDKQTFLGRFINEFYRLFDTRGREDLHGCYDDLCMFSLCITLADNSVVSTRHFTYGEFIHESRNLQKVIHCNKRMMLLRHGKTAVLDFFKMKFPMTKHDENSFHVDVISTANNRTIFTINGLYKEVNQSSNNPIRCFQRTFTYTETPNGIFIIADHIMLSNATEAQISNMTSNSTSTTTTTTTPSVQSANNDIQNQMILKFSQESGMNVAYSELCLQQNNWNYDKAAEVFLAAQQKNMIPSDAFNKS